MSKQKCNMAGISWPRSKIQKYIVKIRIITQEINPYPLLLDMYKLLQPLKLVLK